MTRESARVQCLGMTFESDEARREYFLARLKEKLPELRQRPDFPVADDDDILRLSDPPYYTACPNPFLPQFVEHHGRPYDPDEPYHREPFAVAVSAGKTDPLYRAHGYHTKVPHLAIAPSILHYTQPGDVVLDGFCGSGMTGGRRAMVRRGATDLSAGAGTAVEGGRTGPTAVGRSPRHPRRPVAGGHPHCRQLQHSLRRRRIPRGGC